VDFNQSIFRMRPGLEDIREGVRAITRDFPDVYWRECDENHRYPVEFIAAMQGGGWLSATLPKEYGGSELGLTAAAAILEEVSASGGGMNATSSIHVNLIGVEPILKFGSSAFKAKYLPLITTGKMSFAFGVTEPDAGSDTTRITTKAVRVDGGYRVYGRKVWTTRAKESDRVLLIVRTAAREDCERPAQGMTLLFADLRQKEVDIRPIPKAGRNAVPSYEVAYDGLFVEDGDVVGGSRSRFLPPAHGAECRTDTRRGNSGRNSPPCVATCGPICRRESSVSACHRLKPGSCVSTGSGVRTVFGCFVAARQSSADV